ncbi:MAG: hypothetical protein C0397_13605 [Odoribacter sp.]|nr:hypothetical protein [Odoribacter sp.]
MAPKLSRKSLANLAAIITALLGLAVLIGWQTDNMALKTFGLGAVTMKPNAAFLFLLSGLALLLLQFTHPIAKWVSRFLSLVITLVGLLTLGAFIFKLDFGIDQLLFSVKDSSGFLPFPSRIAANAALNFVLLGTVLFYLSFLHARSNYFIEFCLIAAFSISAIGLLSVIFGFSDSAGATGYSRMAVNTAVAFIILCIGIFFTILHRFEAKITTEQKLFAGLAISATIIGFVSLLSVSSLRSMHESAELVKHTHIVKIQIEDVLISVMDIQSASRGFVISGQENFLEPMHKAMQQVQGQIDSLRKLTSDNPRKQPAINEIEKLIDKRIEFSVQTVNMRRTKGLQKAVKLIETGIGQQLSDSIRYLKDFMTAEENRLLLQRDKEEDKRLAQTQKVILTGVSFMVFLLLQLFFFVRRDLSGRRKAEDELQKLNEELECRVQQRTAEAVESEKKYRDIIETSLIGVYSSNLKGEILYVNNAIVEMMEAGSAEEFSSSPVLALYKKPEDRIRLIRQLQEHGIVTDFESEMITRKGNSITVLLSAKLQDNILTGMILDITKRKSAEEAVLESEMRFRSLFEASPDSIILIDPNDPSGIWPIVDCNETACKMNGYTRGELIGQPIDILNNYSPSPEERTAYLERIRNEGFLQIEGFHRHRDGHIFPIEISTSLVTMKGKELILGIDRDITERKKAEESLREKEERFRRTLDLGVVGMATTHPYTYYFLSANKQLCDMIGYTEEELLQMTWAEITFPKEKVDEDAANVEKLLSGEINGYVMEKQYQHKDGHMIDITLAVQGVRKFDGTIDYILILIDDITERKRAVEKLLNSENRYRSTLNQMIESCQIIDFDWKYIYLNDVADKQNRRPKEELLGNKLMDMWPGIEATEVFQMMKRCMDSRLAQHQEVEFTFADGAKEWFDVNIEPSSEGIFVMSANITERKQAADLIILQRNLGIELSTITDLQELYKVSLEALQYVIGMDSGAIYLFDKDLKSLDMVYSKGMSGQFIAATTHFDENSDMVKLVMKGKPVFIEYAKLPVELSTVEPEEKLYSLASLPLLYKDKVTGCINLVSHKNISIPVFQQKGIETIAVLIGSTIERINIEEQIRNLNADLEIKIEKRTEQLAKTNKDLESEIAEKTRLTKILETNQIDLQAQNKELQQIQIELQEAREKYFDLYFLAPVGYMTVSAEGTILEANLLAASLFGTKLEHLINEPIRKFISEADQELFFQNREKLHETGDKQSFEIRMIKEDGSEFWVQTESMLTGELDDNPNCSVTISDISQRKLAQAEAMKSQAEAERANLAKSEFLSRMSHELRTPMNSILGFAQLMKMGELTPAHTKGVDHILKSGKHLLDLINEVLDLSRIEAGKLSISLEPVQLKQIIPEILDIVRPLAAVRKIILKFAESPVNDLYINADRQKLKQGLLNLINNAIKFNHEGGSVRVEVHSRQSTTGSQKQTEDRSSTSLSDLQPESRNPKPETVRISVTDTGTGISPEDLSKLFIPFQRIGAKISEVEGTGLGLAIAKKLIEAIHGTIGVETEPGVGSTFWIELPQVESQNDHHERKGDFIKPETESVVAGTLLYIEDNVSNIQLVEQIIETHRPSIRLITEMYGKKAVELASDYKPDVILLDLDLPDIHGFEVLKRLKLDAKTQPVPVIVLSADAMGSQIEKLMKAGAANYLTKPIDVLEFLKVVDEVMGKET